MGSTFRSAHNSHLCSLFLLSFFPSFLPSDYCQSVNNGAVCQNGGNCTNLVFDVVSTTEGQCTFPFTYHGQSWDRCIEPDDSAPFCVTADGVKADCIIKATKKQTTTTVNSGGKDVVASAITPGCTKADEGSTLIMSCVGADQRVITSVDFANFGKTTGTCGNYKSASTACSVSWLTLLQSCIGQATCVKKISLSSLSYAARTSLDGCEADQSLAVEFSCGYTHDQGVWINVDLDMLVRGDPATDHPNDGKGTEVGLTDTTISTGCLAGGGHDMRTQWLYPSEQNAGAELLPVGREFKGFPPAACEEGSPKFAMLEWEVKLPFKFTQIRGNFKVNKYNLNDASTHTSPVDGDRIASCDWDDAVSLEGPDKTGTILFGTRDEMLYCGGRYGKIAGTRTFGLDARTLKDEGSNVLVWRMAQDSARGGGVLSDINLQVYYPIASQATLDGLAYAFGFDEASVKTNSFAHTYPVDKDPKHNALDCDTSKMKDGKECPTYTASGVNGGSVHFTEQSLPLNFITPKELGIQKSMLTQAPWSFMAWVRPQYRSCGPGRYCRNPILCGIGSTSGDSKGICLDLVNGFAAVTVDGKPYMTPWKLADMEWSHVAFVFDAAHGTGRTRVYVNGRESILPIPMSCPDCLTGDTNLLVGGSPVETTLKFTGYLDELQFYSRNLTEYEIHSKGDGRPDVQAEVAFHFDGNYRESRFDGASLPVLVEPKWIGVGSKKGECDTDAKGVSKQSVTIPGGWSAILGDTSTLAPINFEKSFTISIWFNPNRPDGILLQSDRGFLKLELLRDRLSFTVAGSTVTQPDQLIPLREWSHVVVRRILTRTTRKVAIFINGIGVEVSSAAPSGNACPPDCSGTGQLPTDNPTKFWLGGSTSMEYKFMFDEVGMYDIALEDGVIKDLTAAMGPTGMSANQVQCDFGSDTCNWNELVGDAGVWWRRRSGPEAGVANDHTTGTTGDPAVCDGEGPCYLYARTTQGNGMSTLMSPWLKMPADKSKCSLSFWYNMASAAQTSVKSCDELGWLVGQQVEEGATQVCSSSKHGPDQSCTWNGKAYLSFAEAEQACLSDGARLCSLEEMNLGVGEWTGCNKDNALIWTKTNDCDDPTQMRTVYGATKDNKRDQKGECHSKTLGRYQTRCCADPTPADTSLSASLQSYKSEINELVWAASDGGSVITNGDWSRALIPLGSALDTLGGNVFMVHLTAGSKEHPRPVGAIDDITLDGCTPPADSDLVSANLQETVVVNQGGGPSAAMWQKTAGGATNWKPASGAGNQKGLLSPIHVANHKLDDALYAAKSAEDHATDPYFAAGDELILGTGSFRMVVVFSLKSTGTGQKIDTLGQRPAFQVGFNNTAQEADTHAVGGALEVRGDSFGFTGDLFKTAAPKPHDRFTEDTIVAMKISRVGTMLYVTANGTSSTSGDTSIAVEVGPAALGRVEVRPLHSRVVVYQWYVEQASSAPAASSVSSVVKSVDIPVHDSHDVGSEVVSSGVVTLEQTNLGLCTSTDATKEDQIVAVRFASVPLSRGDTVQKTTVQFTAAFKSGDDVPSFTIEAELSPDSPRLIELYGNTLPLVPLLKSTAAPIKAGGVVMISSKMGSGSACALLSDDGATYKFPRDGVRRNGVASDRQMQQHGKYVFISPTKAMEVDPNDSAPQVILNIECEIVKAQNNYKLSQIPRTKASVVWKPAQWVQGGKYGTADLSPIMQELVNLPEWQAKSAVTFFFKGKTTVTSRRVAEGYHPTHSSNSPSLVIESLPAQQSLLSQVESTCVFPFTYDKKMYYSCVDGNVVLPPGSTNTKLWCGTKRSVAQDSTDWGFCSSHLVQTTGGVGGGEGSACNFPFVFQGQKYTSCINQDDGAGRAGTPWCSLSANYDADKTWGYCLVPTYGGTTPGAACNFPFWYNGKQYSQCTTDGGRGGGDRPWCATSDTSHSDASPAHWGYCSDGSETERSWGYGCKCPAGFTGHKCQMECYGDTWGKDCLHSCDACRGGQCNGVDGKCVNSGDIQTCESTPGLLPPYCLQGCSPTSWGVGCNEQCAAGCGEGGCDSKTGKCLVCPPGLKGETCSDACPQFSFGADCLQPCACKNGEGTKQECDAISGTCQCDPNGAWIGPQCQLHRGVHAASRVFVNELYFATSSSESDKIEIAGPAGTSLDDWKIHYYYSTCDGTAEGDVGEYNPKRSTTLRGRIPNMANGYGVRVFSVLPKLDNACNDHTSGLMGSGMALVSNEKTVVQFLAYGTDLVSGGKGPVSAGVHAEKIPAIDELPATGRSIALVGLGQYPSDFSWSAGSVETTLNAVNAGEAFGERTVPAVSIDMWISSPSAQLMMSIVDEVGFTDTLKGSIGSALASIGAGADQIQGIQASFIGGAKGIEVTFTVAPNPNNLPPLPSSSEVQTALIRIRTIFSNGRPLKVVGVDIGQTCPGGYVVEANRCTPDLSTAQDCPDVAFTCGECVGASSLCSWSDELGACKKTDANSPPLVGAFVCGPHSRSCCAAIAITHLGPTAACDDQSAAAIAKRQLAIKNELNTDDKNSAKFETSGCDFLTTACGFDCTPAGATTPAGNVDPAAAKGGSGGVVGGVFGGFIALGIIGYVVYIDKKKGVSNYNRLGAISVSADDNYDSDDDALGMEDLGTATPFKRHDPSNDNDAADAYGDEADIVV
jgi:hypothetical protein